MDPSCKVAASVIAVVGAASQIAITLERIWCLRDAPDVVQAIMNEVTQLRALAHAHVLENSMQGLQPDTPMLQDALAVTQRSADRAAKMLEDLDALIQTKLLRSTELAGSGKSKISRRA
ncbi:uncharacterized protein PV07_08378 [Cladophialophora immunda]|uniref:Fungal N-terminal domain-containing protein n=1 Tax=Cladophialophora immunda TaxID=569365 RepID=A0A0D2CEN3_9EURO|nr:uncharacterized protein PV07_08378 [Cladophialophora immunda]KIW28740.1 hypothetical protein PV07_08378 [Cladophialophora immunda]OQV04379.1 hypothetical protein CLAIMM_09270 isoform 1 [Cladophialophora immunda]